MSKTNVATTIMMVMI